MNDHTVVYYFMFEARPFADNPEREDCGGAYISCWVNSRNPHLALNKAKTYIQEEGWGTVKLEESFETTCQRYRDNAESLECFNEAVEYGVSAIFHTWPKT